MTISNYTFKSFGITIPDKENLLCFDVLNGPPTQRLLIPAQPEKKIHKEQAFPLAARSACTLDILSIARLVT